jgi:hypothetical protein
VELLAPIECNIAALAPADDERICALKLAHPTFGNFLARFADNFGERFEPATLLLRVGAPPNFYKIEALASLRDVIAISAITFNRARKLCTKFSSGIVFGEALAVYPWMLDKHCRALLGNTPAISGYHEVTQFRVVSPSVV